MVTEQLEAIATEVDEALNSGQFELPTFPDIAMKIRDLIDDPNVSADQLVNLLSADPVITAHIIKAANSAAASGGSVRVDTVRAAASRLGYRMLRNLVITVTLSKLFKAGSPIIDRKLKQLWERSRIVAANSFVIALHQRHLKPEQAMLAGMIHNLGALPLCIYADRHHPRLDADALDALLRRFSARVGVKLLDNWHFPQEMVDVIAGYENLQRQNENNLSDYTDVVTVASLQSTGTAKFVAWKNVSAAARLGCSPESCFSFNEDYVDQLNIAFGMLELPTRTVTPAPVQEPAPTISVPNKPEGTESSGILSMLRNIFK
ncbi:MAG: HDOD domain-containing protein [Gammaproteobacteria bacterium]|nr:HDOD domain-containing protein [Gammaproteobacteria bacterium]MBU1625319.1 HDOD domain-containing protein [Gammaproteobacteria bacterium]MBU1981579.1 HDOD domain-containing protein [Gammaproteobacteria bacterium]